LENSLPQHIETLEEDAFEHDVVESGLESLAGILAIHHVSTNAMQLRHEIGHDRAASAEDLVRLANRQEGVRAKAVQVRSEAMPRQPLPALAF